MPPARQPPPREAPSPDVLAARTTQLLVDAGVTGRNFAAVHALYDSPALMAARSWMTSPRWALLMSGGAGTGKTVAACALVHAYAKAGYQGRFVKAAVAASLLPWTTEAKPQIEAMRQVPILVLDDLGVEAMTDTWRQVFDDVVDYRYERQLRTVLTTNLPPVSDDAKVLSFRARYGARVADRLRHDSSTAQCGGHSLRRREPK